MEVQLPRITHVIFDMDGLLLDTERLYTEANTQVLAKYGKEFTWDLKKRQMGRKKYDAIKVAVDLLQLPVTVEELTEETDKILMELMPNAEILPGAEKLIKHLHSHKIPIALCTGSSSQLFKVKTMNHNDLFSLFHHLVLCGNDPEVTHGKPDPECFQVCARRFNPPAEDPRKVLVFEDAPNGVEAAVAANMPVVMVPDSRMDQVHKDLATTCLNSLEDFDPAMFGLPKY